MSDSGFAGQPPSTLIATTPTGAPPVFGTDESTRNGDKSGDSPARQVAATAGQGTEEVVGEVRSQAANVLGDATSQARDVVREARSEMRQQASQQTDRVAQGLRTLAGQVEALRNGNPDEAGPVVDYVRQAGDKIQALAGRMESGGLDGIADDVRRFARRRPGTFLVGAAVAGFAVGRLLRSSTGGDGSGVDTPRSPGQGALTPAAPLAVAGPTSYGEPAGYLGGTSGASVGNETATDWQPTTQPGTPAFPAGR